MNARDFVPELVRWEGSYPFMYLDTAGLVTVGIGNMIPGPQAADALPFMNLAAGRLAITSEKEARWRAVAAMEPARPAAHYRITSPEIELDAAAIDDLCVQRLEREFLPALARRFAGFESFPDPAKISLVDMAWNLGMGNTQAQPPRGLAAYRKLKAAIDARDWRTAAAECGRGGRPARTAWTRGKFEEAARGTT